MRHEGLAGCLRVIAVLLKLYLSYWELFPSKEYVFDLWIVLDYFFEVYIAFENDLECGVQDLLGDFIQQVYSFLKLEFEDMLGKQSHRICSHLAE